MMITYVKISSSFFSLFIIFSLGIKRNFRAIFAISSKLQCRMQNGSVKHSNGNCRYAHIVVPYTFVPLHSNCGAFGNYNLCYAWPYRLWGRHSSLESRQVWFRCLHECIHWRRFQQRRSWTSHSSKDLQHSFSVYGDITLVICYLFPTINRVVFNEYNKLKLIVVLVQNDWYWTRLQYLCWGYSCLWQGLGLLF